MSKIVLTEDIILSFCPKGNKDIIKALSKELPDLLTKAEINTPLRISHFLAQAAHESDHFKTLQGYADGSAFEGRKDLGNTMPGDGKKYKERGIFQLAGRYNYEKVGKKLNIDLIGNPELAADPHYSSVIAIDYWNSRKLNSFADKNDILSITKKINGGTNGLNSRTNLFNKINAMVDKIIVSDVVVPTPAPKPEPEPAPKPEPVPKPVPTPKPAPKPKPDPVVKPVDKVIVKPAPEPVIKHPTGLCGVNINLRQNPSAHSEILGIIKKGAVVPVLEIHENWVKVKYENITGWLYKSLVHIK